MQITVSAADDEVQINMSVDEAKRLLEIVAGLPEGGSDDPLQALYDGLKAQLGTPTGWP